MINNSVIEPVPATRDLKSFDEYGVGFAQLSGRCHSLYERHLFSTTLSSGPLPALAIVSRHSPASGWFSARPSGTENIYKIYAESFQGEDHLDAIVSEAREIVARALEKQ